MNHRKLFSKIAITATMLAFVTAAMPASAADGVEVLARSTPEGDYVSQVHDMLVRQMRFPTGREASLTHPEGTVEVWFVLSRDGKLVGHGVKNSSYSTLLDDQADMLVTRTTYPALPPKAWADESDHRFVATYRFVPRTAQTRDEANASIAVR